ncbi:hypothetical protein [Burkholderia gladioli]|uniref:hypothetical protein n=1 Tax=Burkholderia gladioli TaxID=28095 RepID=UPI00163F1AC4|nr:hypothetical protein [Burkholderia gladioli]
MSTPTGPVVIEAERYQLDTQIPERPRLVLTADGRSVAEFVHFAGIWEQVRQKA